VLTVNVPVEAPAATVTVAGTVALELFELRVTEIPPVGATPLRVTVPVEVPPPVTDVGESVTPVSVGGLIVKLAVFEVPLSVPVIVAVTAVDTAVVVVAKVAVVAPAATVTVLGGTALVELEPRVTTRPPVGAGPEIVTVPVEETPPITVVGLMVTLERDGGLIVNVAFDVLPDSVAEMVSVATDATARVVTVNVPEVAPATTVTVPGTVALAALELSVIAIPPVGAGPLRVTVPVEEVPPVTVAGESVRPVSVGGLIVRLAVKVVEPSVPPIVADVVDATAVVVTVKVAEVAPAATVALPGTVAFPLLEASVTLTPPGPAGPLRVTVPVDGVPPVTEVGETAML
jgi:hypothetical protein